MRAGKGLGTHPSGQVQSHSGLLVNDTGRADALAEQGRLSEEVPRWPPPWKPGPLCLGGRASICDTQMLLPDDNVLDELLLFDELLRESN